jgi:hypothetical protein
MTGFIRALRGWLAACAAATGFIFIASYFIAAMATGNFRSVVFAGSIYGLLFPSLVIFVITCLFTAIPAALVIWLGRVFQMRSVWYFGGAGAAIGVLSQIAFFTGLLSRSPGRNPLYALAGLVAGLVYWRIVECDRDAGRSEVSAADSRSPG